MANAKKLIAKLSKRGPHVVRKGNLAVAGVTGVLYTPIAGMDLPALVFAHDWMTGASRYTKTLSHLASWGFVVAAPDTERGLAASDAILARDLSTALDIIQEVRLGVGDISVRKSAAGIAGHGFGAAAAVIAASSHPSMTAFAGLFPAPTSKGLLERAGEISAPAFLLAAGDDVDSLTANALGLKNSWGGDAALRTLPGASAPGLAEGFSLRGALGAGGSDRSTQKAVRALLTGFMLATVADDSTYSVFADATADLADASVFDVKTYAPSYKDPISRLLSK